MRPGKTEKSGHVLHRLKSLQEYFHQLRKTILNRVLNHIRHSKSLLLFWIPSWTAKCFLWLSPETSELTHWGRVTHICVSKLTIIGSDNGLSPGRRQAIIWTNDGILLIGPLETNFREILIGIRTFSFRKMHLKMSSAEWRPFGLGLNVLKKK